MLRILVVDDDADVRELVELALDGQGYDVDSVDSGRAALERLAQHAYDLIVCDLHMTDRDGPAVYRAIERRASPRPAFLFVTGYADAGPYEEVSSGPCRRPWWASRSTSTCCARPFVGCSAEREPMGSRLVLPFVTPTEPTLVSKPFHRAGWVYEEKVDGYRMVAYKDGDQGKDHTHRTLGRRAML